MLQIEIKIYAKKFITHDLTFVRTATLLEMSPVVCVAPEICI